MPTAPAIQVPEYQPQMAQPNMSYQTPAPDLNQQVQNFLAGMSSGESDKNIPPFDFKNWQNTDQSQNYAEQNQDPNYSDANQYARWDRSQENGRPKANQDNATSNYNKQGKKWKGGFTDGPLDENGEYKGKKKPCRFWREGKCAKGEKCTFLHDWAGHHHRLWP